MMRGGFVDRYWQVIAISGLIYLGIGDTVVRYKSLNFLGCHTGKSMGSALMDEIY